VVVTGLPDPQEPTADPVFPDLTVNPAAPEVRVPPVLKARMANQAPMEPLVDAALTEQQALKARPALRGLKVAPQTAKVTRELALVEKVIIVVGLVDSSYLRADSFGGVYATVQAGE